MKRVLEDQFEDSKTAINSLMHFTNEVVPQALENFLPGSAKKYWDEGSPMDFKSVVPVICDVSYKDKLIPLIAKTFQVDQSKVRFIGTDEFKLPRDLDRPRQDNYVPHKTVERLKFEVNWHDTTQPDLVKYRDYTIKNMQDQGIDWESTLTEGINKPVQNRIGNFALDTFISRWYGNSKFTDIADVEVGPDYIDIAFDFTFKEEKVMNGLSGKMSKVTHPTPTEIEVTEKQIDRFMTEQFPKLFFEYYHVTPFFRIEADEHRWLDENSLGCFYNIIQFNEKK